MSMRVSQFPPESSCGSQVQGAGAATRLTARPGSCVVTLTDQSNNALRSVLGIQRWYLSAYLYYMKKQQKGAAKPHPTEPAQAQLLIKYQIEGHRLPQPLPTPQP